MNKVLRLDGYHFCTVKLQELPSSQGEMALPG